MRKKINCISTFFLLNAIFIFQIQSLKAETKYVTASITSKNQLSTVVIPANISVWMDVELSKAKRKVLLTKEQFFTKDSAKVVGYIKGYSPNLGFKTVNLDATNNLTNENRPIVAEIDSMGCFICTIPMNHPQKTTISFGKEFMSVYLEPGHVLALSFDWDDCVKTDGFRDVNDIANILLFKGSLAKLNYDLQSFQLKTLGYRHYWIKETYSPQKYLAVMDSISVENDAHIKQALKEGAISKKVIDIQKNEALIGNGAYLIDYAMTKDDEGIQLPQNFYNMLQLLPLNDPSSLISNNGLFFNRFEYNPVMRKGFKNLPEKKNQSELCLIIWNKKDSLLKSDMKLSSCFAHEVSKVRSLSRDIQNMDKNEAYAYFSKLSEGIKNPFLRQEGLRILKSRFGKMEIHSTDIGIGKPEISSKLPKWIPLSLPKGKDAEIFSKLIAPFKGKYLFVDFWGTSCGPCRWGIEEKKITREKYINDNRFAFIFITCKEWSPNFQIYKKYIKEQGLNQSLFVSNDEFNYLMQLFRFKGVPHYLFIDPNGKVLDTDFEMFLGFDEALKWLQTK